jgi:hypothetical protein
VNVNRDCPKNRAICKVAQSAWPIDTNVPFLQFIEFLTCIHNHDFILVKNPFEILSFRNRMAGMVNGYSPENSEYLALPGEGECARGISIPPC